MSAKIRDRRDFILQGPAIEFNHITGKFPYTQKILPIMTVLDVLASDSGQGTSKNPSLL